VLDVRFGIDHLLTVGVCHGGGGGRANKRWIGGPRSERGNLWGGFQQDVRAEKVARDSFDTTRDRAVTR